MNAKEYRVQLAECFIRILEERQLDWKKEWKAKDIPISVRSGKSYKGINRFRLTLIAMERGYQDPRWATFKQIEQSGWRLKNAKGQGVKVEYWYPYDTVKKKNLTWEEFLYEGVHFGERYQLRSKYATVFNASLIDGIQPLPDKKENQIISDELIQRLSQDMNVSIINDGGSRAYYRPSDDTIHLPMPEDFTSDYDYNSTALHELTHATGAGHRLGRALSGRFGSEEYAFEELIAEISSCFMSVHLEVAQNEKHIENHKAYVQMWVQHIREKPEELVRAIQEAEKATAYMEYKAELIPREEFEKIVHSSAKVDEKIIPDILPGKPDNAQHHLMEKAYNINQEHYVYLPKTGEQSLIDDITQGLQQIGKDTDLFENILVIQEYEKSIGRSDSVLATLNEDKIQEYAMRCERYLEFGREVDQCIQGVLPMREALKVCDTPQIMQEVGCHMLPMHMTQKHLRNCIRDKTHDQPHHHGLKIEEIKRIPEELENPAVLSESLSRKDSIVAILGYREQDGLPIIVSIIPDGQATYHLERVDSNFITSAYGKENTKDFVRRIAESGKLLYINKEKSEELALLPLQLRQDHPAPAFDCIIKRIDDEVKENKNITRDMVQEEEREQGGAEEVEEYRARRVKAETLPSGWIWVMYPDGSGCLESPEKVHYFEYDRTTGECKRMGHERYNFDYYDALQEDFTKFRSLAEGWIQRKVLGKEAKPHKEFSIKL